MPKGVNLRRSVEDGLNTDNILYVMEQISYSGVIISAREIAEKKDDTGLIISKASTCVVLKTRKGIRTIYIPSGFAADAELISGNDIDVLLDINVVGEKWMNKKTDKSGIYGFDEENNLRNSDYPVGTPLKPRVSGVWTSNKFQKAALEANAFKKADLSDEIKDTIAEMNALGF